MTTSSVLMKFVREQLGNGGSIYQKWAGIPGQAWCDAFISYSLNKTDNGSLYCNGAREINCPHSMNWCFDHLAMIPIYIALPGDVTFFDWEPNGLPNHVGFVEERISSDEYYTIEGNTSGGKVDRKKRTDAQEQATFRLHYTPDPFSADKKLEVDGLFGYNSIAVMQRWLKACGFYTGEIDAIMGRQTVKALQSKLGVTADGSWGPKTTKALQKLVGTTQDGSAGPETVKAFQKYLNEHVSFTVTPAKPTPEPTPEPTPSAGKYKVIDVSEWQGKIDWPKVKADGVVGAIIRYADGDHLDPYFDRNMSEAKANGLHIGAYIFSRSKSKTGGENEAVRLYNACKPYAPDLPLYIDLEDAKLKSYANTVAQAFLRKMKALGGRGGVYANLNWWNNYLADTAKNYSSNPFWIAQYYDKVTHKTPSLFGMWQYSSSGSVSGITGKVDMDWLYIPYWETAPTPSRKYDGTLPSLKLVKSPDQVIADALTFARWIVNDNRFGYGRKGGKQYKGTKDYSITHSGGCHFCGSNAGKISRARKAGLSDPEQWEYTYVCNTYVHACYAHGGIPSMLSARGHAWWTKNYQKSSYWTEIKKPAKITDLKPGDVLGADATHYALYLGNEKIAEATSNGNAAASKEKWASSIHITGSGFFKSVDHVFRLTKAVNTTALIKYGEVSYRVKQWQAFLNWYNGKKVVEEDGIFGDATLKYTKAFQTAKRIAVDGIIGSGTIAAAEKEATA